MPRDANGSRIGATTHRRVICRSSTEIQKPRSTLGAVDALNSTATLLDPVSSTRSISAAVGGSVETVANLGSQRRDDVLDAQRLPRMPEHRVPGNRVPVGEPQQGQQQARVAQEELRRPDEPFAKIGVERRQSSDHERALEQVQVAAHRFGVEPERVGDAVHVEQLPVGVSRHLQQPVGGWRGEALVECQEVALQECADEIQAPLEAVGHRQAPAGCGGNHRGSDRC